MRLDEVSRSTLLNKSINAKPTKAYGTTRYNRRIYQHIKNDASVFNNIDMNSMFKTDMLYLNLPVKGETDDYTVSIMFDGACKDIQRELKKNRYKFEYKVIHKAIMRAINNQNMYIGCTCNDFKFRLQYHATKQKYNALKAQLVPANITNPNDDQGAGCKHIMAVLSDLNWAMQLSTAIHNYIVYMQENMPDLYEKFIFKAVYGMPYQYALDHGFIDEPEDLEEPVEEPISEIEEFPEDSIIEDEVDEND